MSLTDKLEVWGFENDIMIYRDFSLGQILRLKPRDVSTSTDDEINSIHHVACDFLNGLPEGTSLQFVQGIDQVPDSLFEKHRDLAVETAKPIVCKVLAERTGRLELIGLVRDRINDGQADAGFVGKHGEAGWQRACFVDVTLD